MIQGKDAVLCALSALCVSCHKSISAADPDAPDAILSLILSACSKKSKKYREAAFSCLEQVFALWFFEHLCSCRQGYTNFLPAISDSNYVNNLLSMKYFHFSFVTVVSELVVTSYVQHLLDNFVQARTYGKKSYRVLVSAGI